MIRANPHHFGTKNFVKPQLLHSDYYQIDKLVDIIAEKLKEKPKMETGLCRTFRYHENSEIAHSQFLRALKATLSEFCSQCEIEVIKNRTKIWPLGYIVYNYNITAQA